MPPTNTEIIDEQVAQEYKWGFVTDIEQDTLPPGLNEEVVRFISAKKQEPEWLLEWRLKAYRHWLTMTEPTWPNVTYPKIDYQAMVYWAAPKDQADGPKSLDEVDPEILATYEKLGIPLHEQKMLAGVVAVDAVFDSVSVATTFKSKLAEAGVIFCSMSEAVHEHPELVQKYLGSVVPTGDNFFAALNSAVFSDGSFVYIPEGVRCPMELSTYFRINAQNTGQFERTLIVAEKGSHVSYLEGCTAPKRDENQLHAAVVEIYAHEDADVKYSTVQNWYPGDPETGKGGIYNFVTKRGLCQGARSKISWTQVETGSAITWKYPSVILKGDDSTGEFYSVAVTKGFQQADTGTKMIHVGKNTRSTIISKGISAGRGQNTYRGQVQHLEERRQLTQLLAVRLDAHRRPLRGAHLPLHRRPEHHLADGARGLDLEDRRRPALLLRQPRPRRRGRAVDDRQRLLQRGLQGAADGVRGRSAPPPRGQPRRQRRLAGSSCPSRSQRTAALKRKHCTEKKTRNETMSLLEIKNLHAGVEGVEILKGLDLTVQPGEVHAIMGPNGSGKSTLAQVLAGREDYEVTEGTITYRGEDLLELDPEIRAREGIFLAFQYPVEIPGVSNVYFLKAALNAIRKHRDQEEIDAMDFLTYVRGKMEIVKMDEELLQRPVNEGFSGGEKKRNEVFHMAVLDPVLAVLDETDSGLDIDALKIVAKGVNSLRSAGPRLRRHHPLSAAPRVHRAGRRPRHGRRQDRADRRQGARRSSSKKRATRATRRRPNRLLTRLA